MIYTFFPYCFSIVVSGKGTMLFGSNTLWSGIIFISIGDNNHEEVEDLVEMNIHCS